MSSCKHHQQCIDEAMAHAEAVCARSGARLTPLRRRVLAAIWQSHEAVKAYSLIHELSSEDHTLKPPTIYRTLDFLRDQGLIHRIESLNAYVGCDHPAELHDPQLLICDGCGHVEELSSAALDTAMADAADQAGFAVTQSTIEVHGLCRQCAERAANESVDAARPNA
ncbi:MAG: transcriptional repressor [Halothiobacillaceae bacterium]